MSDARELINAVRAYAAAREMVRDAPEDSADLGAALGWAASAWSRVAEALAKADVPPQGTCPRCLSTYIKGCAICGDDYP